MPIDLVAEVIANTPLSPDYNVIAIAAPAIAAAAQPGQFVMVKPSRGLDPLLRRPFSVFEIIRDDGGAPTALTLLSKRIGPVTSRLYDVRAGDTVACLGPLGTPWPTENLPAQAYMVAGGVGLAPFALLAETFRRQHVPTTLFYGARRGSELFYLDLFENLDVELVLTTEDGSRGQRGLVTAPLERALARSTPSSRPGSQRTARTVIYTCGPEAMMRAVARLAARYRTSCHVSMERIMGCGMGGCYSCIVPVRSGTGFHNVRSCIDGPVMAAEQIVWD